MIIIIIAAGIILIPNAPLAAISISSQTINGILLPVVLICMMIIVNKKEVMGKHVNKPIVNVIGWAAISILVVLSLILLITSFIH